MSRSNTVEKLRNPAARFYEWGGEGEISYWDKDKEERITAPFPFTFMLLDQVSQVAGWNDASESRIYSNAVQDLQQPLCVKAFKGGPIAEGRWEDIREGVKAAGGKFAVGCYIATKAKAKSPLELCHFLFTGASLGAWFDFVAEARKQTVEVDRGGRVERVSAFYAKAIQITGASGPHKKGKVEYYMPEFKLKDIKPETDAEAVELDTVVQAYLRETCAPKVVAATGTQPDAGTKTDLLQLNTPEPETEDVSEDVPADPDNDDDVPF